MTDKELMLFVRGELRTDGWVSDWQKDLLRRRAEETDKAPKTKWSKGKSA